MEEKRDLGKFRKRAPVNSFIAPLFTQEVTKSSFERTGAFLRILNQPRVNLVCLRSYAFRGVPDECVGLRGVVWRLLLGYLPAETKTWEAFVENKREEYAELSEKYRLPELTKSSLSYNEITPKIELAKAIKVDIKRTKQEVPFFSMIPHIPLEESIKQRALIEDEKYDFVYDSTETHRLAIARLLHVYANANDNLGYVQGMNEVASVIYYCFYNNSSETLRVYTESDTYFCFCHLMDELKDLYFKERERIATGVKRKVERVSRVLQRVDPEYWAYLASVKADMLLLTMRWIMLIFAQDLPLADTVRLWDSVLGDCERFLFFDYFIAAVFVEAKEKVHGVEFYELSRLLNETPRLRNLQTLLKNAGNMLAKDLSKDQYIGEHY